MGFRLSKIVTRTGDDGTTGLGDGSRVGKDHARIAALGNVDELNSALGCVLAEDVPPPVRTALARVQNDLFDLGGELAIPGREAMRDAHVEQLDRAIATVGADLPPLVEFVLPGGTRAASMCHLARTVCRRAERSVTALARDGGVSAPTRQYLNRLSDLLFQAARAINRAAGTAESTWKPGQGIAK